MSGDDTNRAGAVTGRATVVEPVGEPVNRLDGRLKVTGKARYAVEFHLPNMAYAVLLQSTIPKGRILEVDTSAAEKCPGVIKVMTYKNAPLVDEAASPMQPLTPLLQDNRVYYNRQNIGVLIADSFEAARDAAALVTFKYAEEKFDVAMRDEPSKLIVPEPQFGRKPDNKRGDIEQGLSQAKVKLVETYTTPTENHNPMETHATTCVWNGDSLTVYDSSQSIFAVRQKMAKVFGIPGK